MSSPILPIGGPPAPPTPPSSRAGNAAAFVSELDAPHGTLTIEAGRGGPPPEVLAEMAAAARVHESLSARGRELRFTPAAGGGRVGAELIDTAAGTARAVSLSEALDISAGKPTG
jgi:hypothetical protein